MKKRILSWSILVGVIIIVAIGIPRITANEASPLGSSEEKKKVEELEENFRKWSLEPLDKFMVQSYQAKPNGHQWNSVKQKSIKNYRVTYYTFFGFRYMEAEVS
ncbi:hypothetical protein C2I27_18105 [Priestia megaterium]|uniref:Uncharacterized protein n=2 Tax=Priestia TaxID=2800373 RepID=A0AAX6N2F4_PRIAR|nr:MULTISPECIES: hypothetical protein [Priestia]MBU8853460.1 hypothetical protein [Bacillus sp. FJAT-26377]AEN90402.1 hypothetical protein BMWSH_3520 [Priestia megaterium WSH-002]MBY0061286.1 hypothetical protein [Priestia aryabhattai]MDN3361814.1 hypothetical protein [Priestia megaterium]MDU9690091.1 hypothetical protein [Priestia aryabhattai]